MVVAGLLKAQGGPKAAGFNGTMDEWHPANADAVASDKNNSMVFNFIIFIVSENSVAASLSCRLH
jgi:hypothetical protein